MAQTSTQQHLELDVQITLRPNQVRLLLRAINTQHIANSRAVLDHDITRADHDARCVALHELSRVLDAALNLPPAPKRPASCQHSFNISEHFCDWCGADINYIS